MENVKKNTSLHIFSIILFSLSSLTFALYTYLFVSMNIQIAIKEAAEGTEQFGAGLGVAILLIFMSISGIALIVFSVISIVLSHSLKKRSEGGRRTYALVSKISSISYIALGVIFFLYVYILL